MRRTASLGGLIFFLTGNGNLSIAAATTDDFGCHCPLLSQIECNECVTNCIWETSLSACQATSSTGVGYSKWNGFLELGQTHVVKATGETRHAPEVIAEREAELLFTPTELPPLTVSPTPAPTSTIVHEWGLEQLGEMEVKLANSDDTWVTGYPDDESMLVVQDEGADNIYFIHENNTDININFDLSTNRLIQGVYLKTWYNTKIGQIEVAVHQDEGDEGEEGEEPQPGSLAIPDSTEGGWTVFSAPPVTGGYNNVRVIHIPKLSARYVQIRLRGSQSGHLNKWGLRHIQMSGNPDGLVDVTITKNEEYNALDSVKYIPSNQANIRVAAYSDTGSLLGILDMRNPTNQRPLLEQSLTSTSLEPYSESAWSATLPWHWIKEGTKLLVGTTDPTTKDFLLHKLILHRLGHWGIYAVSRNKFAIFGTPSEFAQLDTFTHEPSKLARGMFNTIPTSELRWVDSEVWHLPYLVIRTSSGPKMVSSEAERRQALVDAGDDPCDEPRWEIIKEHLAYRHRLADTGFGLSNTGLSCNGIHASGESIFMGWALSQNYTNTIWHWSPMGYWDKWLAAAWIGWCGMKPGDECGRILSHELGHSQTMAHFRTGTAANWGIQDEYPQDGVNLAMHPWGYDSTSRRFRTWYKHDDISVGKHDPMNDGMIETNDETCFVQYTGYQAAKAQQWAKNSPVLLSKGMGKNVDSDGTYYYSSKSRQYEKVTQENITSIVGEGSFLPLEVGVPVVTLVGTIGDSDEVCQIYPAVRSSYGNTFELPKPDDSNLPSMFNGAMHSLEVHFGDGSIERGLIAVPSMKGSTELRFFSLTVAISRHPIAIDLYRYDIDAYPNLVNSSTKKKLYSRSINLLQNDPLKGLAPVLRVGRGHLGYSTGITIDHRCIDEEECFSTSKKLKWRGTEGANLSYSATNSNQIESNVNGTLFDLSVKCKEDGTEHKVTVVVSRFIGENGPSCPLSESFEMMSPDGTHGIRVWAPYELNKGLAGGVYYTPSSQDGLKIVGTHPDNSIHTTFWIFVKLTVLEPTEVVDLTDQATFTSSTKFFPASGPDAPSSAYFLATDPSIGPTHREWQGTSYETLKIPMYASCTGEKVIANVKAQQTTTCSTSTWQFNAGRNADQCGHMLVLTLGGSDDNPWVNEYPQGCTFSTHPNSPIIIDAFSWHYGNWLGSLVLKVTVTI